MQNKAEDHGHEASRSAGVDASLVDIFLNLECSRKDLGKVIAEVSDAYN